jgi:hypothetical protein
MPTHHSPRLWVLSAVLFALVARGTAQTAIPLQAATATFNQIGFDVGAAIDGIGTGDSGWAIFDGSSTSAQTATFETVANAGFAGGTALMFSLVQAFTAEANAHTLGRFRLSFTTDARGTFTATSGSTLWTVLSPSALSAVSGATMTLLGDQSVLVSGALNHTDSYTFSAVTGATNITGFRLELLEHASLPNDGPGRQSGNIVLTELGVTATAVPEPAHGAAVAGLALLGFAALLRARTRQRQGSRAV